MTLSLGISVGGPPAVVASVAAAAERRRLNSIWLPETARTAYIAAAVALQATTTITVGTSIALAFPRSPVITAMTARDLSELGGGRFVLGLGTQVKRVNEQRYATPFEHPAPKMREIIEICREVWASFGGDPLQHHGRFFEVTMPPFPGAGPPPSPIPIGVAGVNVKMVELAGASCEYFLGHPFTSVKYVTDVVRPALEAGRIRAGRPEGSCRISQGAITSVAATTQEALRGAKLQIGFYGTTRTYAPLFALHGWDGTTDALREAFGRGDMDALVGCITDEMAETYSIFGTVDEVRDKLQRWDGIVDEVVAGPPWASPETSRTEDVFSMMLDAVAPA